MAETLTIVLKADGSGLTGTLSASTGEFRKFGLEVDKAGKNVENAGRRAEEAGRAAKRGAEGVDAAQKKWEKLGANVGTVIGGLITGFTALMVKQINFADNTGKMAERLGVSTRFISEMGYAAKESGVNTATLEGAISALNISATKAADGVKGPLQAFRAIGVTATDSFGKVKSLDTLLPQIADRFAKLEDGPRKSAAAMALFGEQGRQLLPLLNQGSAGIDDLRAKAVELGLSLGDDAAARAAEFNDNLAALKDQSLGLINHLAEDALPALAKFSANLVADGKAASEAGQSYTALGLIINALATGYYYLQAVVGAATAHVAAGIDTLIETAKAGTATVWAMVTGAGSALKALATGDISGAVAAVETTVGRLKGITTQFAAAATNNANTAHAMTIEVFGEAKRRTIAQWSDTVDDATRATRANATATEEAGKVYTTAAASQREKERADRAAAQATRALNDLIRDQQNEYVGPVTKALNDYHGVLAKVAKQQEELVRVGRFTAEAQELVNTALAETARAYVRNLQLAEREQAEMERRRDIVGSLVQDYMDESRAVAASAREHTIQQALLRAEDQARKNFNKGLRDTISLTAEEVNGLRAAMDVAYTQRLFLEQSAAAAEDYRSNWWNAIDSVSGAFGDWLTGGIRGFRGFTRELLDIGKRWVADMIATMARAGLGRLFLSWSEGAGSGTGGNWMGQLGQLLLGGRNMTGTGAMAAGNGWIGTAASVGSMAGLGNSVDGLASIAGASAGGSGGLMDVINMGGTLVRVIKPGSSMAGMIGKFAGSPVGMWGGAALGALYGWQQGGDTVGKGLGAAAYGVAGYAGMAALGAGAGAIAGGATIAGAGTAALGAIPVAGWIALAAIAVDKISGGKLFGTKYQTKETGQTIDIGADGGTASAWAYQEGQKSLFRGKKRRTIDLDASDEAKESATALYQLIQQTAKSAADALGLASVDVVSGSYKAVYDKKGNLISELATVLGRTFNEGFEQFQQRLQAENIVAQVAQLDDAASAIAERWRSSADKLLDGAQFLLAAAADFNNGAGLLTVGGLTRLTDLIEHLRQADETLTAAYQRVMGNASAYGTTAAAAYQEVATAGFSTFAKSLLQVKQEEKERIRTLQAQAKALGGLSAREEDLAKVREAAQLKTDALVSSLKGELIDLALNRLNDQIEQLGGSASGAGSRIEEFINSLRLSDTLSPDTDARRRVTANDLMNTAALAGDVDAFTQYAQQFLEVSRNLNASAAGYQADYDRVLELARQFGGDGNAASLEQLYAQRSALQAQQEAAARLERAQRIAQGVSDLAGVNGGDPLEILRSVTGMTAADLAKDLGLSTDQLGQYLERQQTDIGDLADILYELPQRIASEMVIALADRIVPVVPGSGTPAPAPSQGGNAGPSTTTVGENRLIQTLDRLDLRLARQEVLDDLRALERTR